MALKLGGKTVSVSGVSGVQIDTAPKARLPENDIQTIQSVNESQSHLQVNSNPINPLQQSEPIHAELVTRLLELKDKLTNQTPGIADSLHVIHRILLSDPSQVTIMTAEQRAIFFQGLMKQTMTAITTSAAKGVKKKFDIANMTLDDLM